MVRKNKTALVFGGDTGMDGRLMVELLKSKDYEVVAFPGRSTKGEILHTIDTWRYDEIYNFAGYSDTFAPFSDVEEVIQANLTLPASILDAICKVDKSIKFFNASSCLIFGKTNNLKGTCSEKDILNPIYSYGVTKLAANHLIKEYREGQGLFACSGIFFPHEHYTRGDEFFSKKIAKAVARIKNGSTEKIKISQNSSERDWGWAPDYVEAAYLMLQNKVPTDYVIGTGNAITVNMFIWKALQCAGLDPLEHVEEVESAGRNNDWTFLAADITKINKELGWSPKNFADDVIKLMVDYEIEQLQIKNKDISL